MGTAASAQRAHRSFFGPAVYGIAILAFRLALIAAGLAAAYLLFGLLSGQLSQFPGLPQPSRVRIFANVMLAHNVLNVGLAAAAFLGAYVFLTEQAAGYLMVLAGLLLYAGVPFGVSFLLDANSFQANTAMRHALVAFRDAAWSPFLFGGILIVRDVFLRLVEAIGSRPLKRESLQYGANAEPETVKRPVRLSPLGKCWEGPFCREFIRVYCPIFHARKACWRVKKGCYCEEEIVNNATFKISGIQLGMAPDPRYNFANAPTSERKPELTPGQKRERCRHCVIYNQHQREKYTLLLPFVVASVVGLCVLLAPLMRAYLGFGLWGIDTLMARFSFGDTSQGFSWVLGHPSPTVEWIFVGAFTVMLLSKALQVLEWAVFKIKI